MAIKFTGGKPTEPKEFFVQPGEYSLRVVEAKEDTFKSGNDGFVITFAVLNGDGTTGPKFTENLVMTKKAFWKIDNFLKACDKHPGEGEAVELDADEMVGWECRAKLGIRTGDKGGKFNEVASFLYDEF